ncbi:hypothetical protein HHK36_019013 [Tetracentron sinense]|uniref:Uncharacterized protein n=1 Tax=Tetracentron sinense TaxID=13715 RepID=A0A835D8S6_TETSI|nr:hypothetical protein HHK36_019013 [Tetracentron sinense]
MLIPAYFLFGLCRYKALSYAAAKWRNESVDSEIEYNVTPMTRVGLLLGFSSSTVKRALRKVRSSPEERIIALHQKLSLQNLQRPTTADVPETFLPPLYLLLPRSPSSPSISDLGVPVSRVYFWVCSSMAAPPARARADYDHLIKLLLIGDSDLKFIEFLVSIVKVGFFDLVVFVCDSRYLMTLGNVHVTDFDPCVGKSCLLLRFSDGSFTTSFITTIGIDFKIRTIELDGKRIKLQIWDTAGQERFRTITTEFRLLYFLKRNHKMLELHQLKGGSRIHLVGSLKLYYLDSFPCFCAPMELFLSLSVDSYEAGFSPCSDIKNWIRNIEQHASDNVNKILVGNKADMDESKRAVPTSKGQALADEYGIKFFETSAKTNLNVEQGSIPGIKPHQAYLTDFGTCLGGALPFLSFNFSLPPQHGNTSCVVDGFLRQAEVFLSVLLEYDKKE